MTNWRLSAGLLAALALLAGLENPAMSAAPPPAAAPFAAAVAGTGRPLGQPLTVTLPAGLAHGAVLIGVVAGPDGDAALLVPVTPDGRAGTPLRLGGASAIRAATLLDLARPVTLDLTAEALAGSGRGRPARPALLVRMQAGTAGRERLALVVLSALPQLLWSAVSRETSGPGGGFETLELSLSPGPDRPDLTLLQHALPTPGEAGFLPGPPLTVEYRWRGGDWHREP